MIDKENPALARGASGEIDHAGKLINSHHTARGSDEQRERLPNRRRSVVFNFRHADAMYRCTASRFADGRLAEVFLTVSKAGSTLQQHADTAAVLASLALQHGVDAETIRHSVRGSAVAAAIELADGAVT